MGARHHPFFNEKIAKKLPGGPQALAAAAALEREMAQRSTLQHFPSWEWVRMKGKKLWWEQRFMGSRTGRCTFPGAAGEAKACE